MGFGEEVLKKIFKNFNSSKEEVNQVTSEKLIRSYAYQKEFESWKTHPETIIKLHSLHENLKLSMQGFSTSMEVAIWQNNSANGFVVYPTPQFSPKEYRFLLDWLKEKTKLEGYRLYHSKLETSKNTKTESYYLKPSLAYAEPNKLIQRYGNILLALEFKHDEMLYLKGLVTFYHGRNYTEAISFEQYLSNILKP